MADHSPEDLVSNPSTHPHATQHCVSLTPTPRSGILTQMYLKAKHIKPKSSDLFLGLGIYNQCCINKQNCFWKEALKGEPIRWAAHLDLGTSSCSCFPAAAVWGERHTAFVFIWGD